jgi:hypothetical protein
MRLFRQQQSACNVNAEGTCVDTPATTTLAVKQKLYRDKMTPEARAVYLDKAKTIFQKWKKRMKDNEQYRFWLWKRRKPSANYMRRYREARVLSVEEEAAEQAAATIRSQQQRRKYKQCWSYESYVANKFGGNKASEVRNMKKARTKRYWATYSDTTTVERSRKRRWCIHPPCKTSTLVDGVVHFGKYCPHLYPGARQLHMEALRQSGDPRIAQFDPAASFLYIDGWNRSYAKRCLDPPEDYEFKTYANLEGEVAIVDLDDQYVLRLLHLSSDSEEEGERGDSEEEEAVASVGEE